MSIPADGVFGVAFPATGCDDENSAEYGAWLFQPDDDEEAAFYCDPDRDLEWRDAD